MIKNSLIGTSAFILASLEAERFCEAALVDQEDDYALEFGSISVNVEL